MSPKETIDGTIFLSSREAGKISNYTHDYIARLCRDGKLIGQKINRTWYVREDSLLLFLDEYENEKEARHQALSQERKLEQIDLHEVTTGALSPLSLKITALAFSFLLLFASAFSVFHLNEKFSSSQSTSLVASVLDTETFSEHAARFVYETAHSVWATLASFFIREKKYAVVNTDVQIQQQKMHTDDADVAVDNVKTPRFEKKGVVVVPADPNIENDVAMREIKNSFSDEVDIKFEDPESGVITPVFKERDGDDYLFVLVPLDE